MIWRFKLMNVMNGECSDPKKENHDSEKSC